MNDTYIVKPLKRLTLPVSLFLGVLGLASVAISSSQPCTFPDIALCGPVNGVDGTGCAVGNVIGVLQTSSECEIAWIYSCYGRDNRCALAAGQCNVWSAFPVYVCDVNCVGNEPNGQIASVYAGWCGEAGSIGSGRTLNQRCSGGPCDPQQAIDPIPPLEPPIPPNPPSHSGLDWPQVINFFENPGGGGD